jgi:WD40 repeat protein
MIAFENENIMQLIFNNFNTFKIKRLFENAHNKALALTLLKTQTYEKLFKSIGKPNIILNDTSITSLLLLPDNNILMLADMSIKVFDTANNCFKCIITEDEYLSSAVLLPNGNIVISSWAGILKIYNLNKGLNYIKRINLQEYDCFKHFDESWKMFLTLDESKVICSALLEINYYIVLLEYNSKNEFECKHAIVGHPGFITSIVNIFNKRIASSSYDDIVIKIWDIIDGFKCIKELSHKNIISSLIFNERNNVLLSASEDKTIKVWDMMDYQCINTILSDFGNTCLCLLPNGFFASGDRGWKVRIWDMKTFKCINSLEVLVGYTVSSLLFLKDNRLVTFTGKNLIIWSY